MTKAVKGKKAAKAKKPVKTDPHKDVIKTLYNFYIANLANPNGLLQETLKTLDLLGSSVDESPLLSKLTPLKNIANVQDKGALLKECIESFIKLHNAGTNIEPPIMGNADVIKNSTDLGLPDADRKDTHIFLACPCYGGLVTYKYMAGVMELQRMCWQLGIKLTWKPIGNESLIQRGRMVLSSIFIENPEYTHLFFIDADIGFDPRSVLKMLKFDKPLVTQAYPKKAIDWGQVGKAKDSDPATLQASAVKYCVSWLNTRTPEGHLKIDIEEGFAKVRDAPTGFMLIKREVFERMMAKWPTLNYTNDVEGYGIKGKVWRFFDCMVCPETDRYLSEDYAFCHRWRELGGDVWMDMNSNLSHSGSYEFKGHLGHYIKNVMMGGNIQPHAQQPPAAPVDPTQQPRLTPNTEDTPPPLDPIN